MRTESRQLDDVQNRPPEPNGIEVDINATHSSVDEIVPVLNVNSYAYRYGEPMKLVNGTPRGMPGRGARRDGKSIKYRGNPG
jgi:hypothetical protein